MALDNLESQAGVSVKDVGILFISPIIGLPPSLISVFDEFKTYGVGIEGVDILEGQEIKKGLWNILKLTVLPGSHKRRITFANSYNESRLFEAVLEKISSLKTRGKRKIIVGGMSGGFIFAARMAADPPDREAAPYARAAQPFIKGLFGVSPLIFYPSGVLKNGANLENVPALLPVTLIWGDGDTIVPKGTIAYAQRVSNEHPQVRHRVIRGSEVGKKDGSIKHQFFGGRDFYKPLTNVYWNAKAERIALKEVGDLLGRAAK